MNAGQNKRGTVFVAIILLLIVITIILSIARHFWLDSANEHFDGLIAIYIAENQDLTPDDHAGLKARLIESGIFIKMHRWDRDSFIEDAALYKKMITARDHAQMRRDGQNPSTMEIMINL